MIRVFIGYDRKEEIAAHVLARSIQSRASEPVAIAFLDLHQLRHIYWRDRDPRQSTDFAYTRFLVPHLCNFTGRAIFLDCDMLVRGDIAELWHSTDNGYAVNVVKHDYTPKTASKFLGQVQTVYPKKNWSSVIVFNCWKCRELTPTSVSSDSGMFLHQFLWTEEDRIGEIDPEWNWLVGEYPYNPTAKLVHFTLGTPCFKQYQDCDYADEWYNEFNEMCHCDEKSGKL